MITPKSLRSDADITRKRILTAARKLFAKKGFSATPISEIASKAKVNQSLIYHHFESKEGLWKCVKRNITAMSTEELMSLPFIQHPQSFAELSENLIDLRFKLCRKHPDFTRILFWQNLEPNSGRLLGLSPEFYPLITSHIKRFQESGEISAQDPPSLILLSMFSLISGYFSDCYQVLRNCQSDKKDCHDEAYLSLIKRMVIKSFC